MTLCFIFLTQNCTEYIYQIYLELTKSQKVETFLRKKESIIVNGVKTRECQKLLGES